MQIKRFVNSIFNSNTYLLYKTADENAYVIDPGNCFDQLFNWLTNNKKKISGIFLTHTHFDHILGLNDLREKFPSAEVYASVFATEGMLSEKLNGSLYKEIPFTIKRADISIIEENDCISLWEGITLSVFETPGHDRDCLSFQIEKNLFTGDALIPGIKVFTKLKYSNKVQAENSINRILEQFDDDTIIWPGHEDNCLLQEFKKQ